MTNKTNTYCAVTVLITLIVHVSAWLIIKHGIAGDELRYLDQAARILGGIELYENGRVVNPPLLPLFFALAQRIGIPIEYLPLLSISSIAIATLFLFKILAAYCSPRWACLVALLLPLHPVVIKLGSQLMSEPYAILFGVLAAFSMQRAFLHERVSFPAVVAMAICLAGLAMLKPLFGYTLLAALLLSLLIGFIARFKIRAFFFHMSTTCCLALIFCTPFLIFTYLESGKIFKWSTGTGDHMYWMSIGGEDVWGSWVPDNLVNDIPYLVQNGYADEFNAALKMSQSERDQFLQSLALKRIKSEPHQFVRNIAANAGRVLFNYPYSFRPQSLFTYGYILPNMMLYLPLVLSFALLPLTWRHQDLRQSWLLAFFFIYLAGNIVAGSTGRQGLVLIAPVLAWLAFQIRLLSDLGILNFQGTGSNKLKNRP